QAAAHVLLRHDVHLDGTHYHARKPGGLHPSYAAFNPSVTTKDFPLSRRVAFFSCGLNQILLQIAMQDHLDGGISILICCPGFKADTTPSPEEVALDLYVTSCELQE
ncbi:uncharacterized protein F5891DRAFT_934467, partial [Suillus fuscotomentosus]